MLRKLKTNLVDVRAMQAFAEKLTNTSVGSISNWQRYILDTMLEVPKYRFYSNIYTNF